MPLFEPTNVPFVGTTAPPDPTDGMLWWDTDDVTDGSVASLDGVVLATVVSVGTSAVPLPASALSNRRTIIVQADSANTASIYIGGSAVTADAASTGGLVLDKGESLALDAASGDIVYAIGGASSQKVRCLEGS